MGISAPSTRFSAGRKLPALLTVAAFFAVVLTAFTPFFKTNDDVVLQMIASGSGFIAGPDEHLLFSNFLFGWLLKSLYLVFPAVSWYGMVLLTIHFGAFALILKSILARPRALVRWFLFGFFLLLFGLWFVTHLSFTSAAFFASLSGLLVWLKLVENRERPNWKGQVAVASMLLTGALVRWEAFLMAGLLMAPLLLRPFVVAQLRPFAVRQGTFLLVIVLGALLLQMADRQYYVSDSDWAAFPAYNSLRSHINDYEAVPDDAELAAKLDFVDWSRNDYDLFRAWCGLDRVTYSQEHLQWLVDQSDGRPLNALQMPHFPGWWLVVFLAYALLMIQWKRTPLIKAGLVILSAAAVFVYLSMTKKMPATIELQLWAFVAVLLISLGDRKVYRLPGIRELVQPRRAFVLGVHLTPVMWLCIYLLPLAGFSAWNNWAQWKDNRWLAQQIAPDSAALTNEPLPDDAILIVWGDALPLQMLWTPFHTPKPFPMVAIGYLTSTPHESSNLSILGIADLFYALAERKDCYLICNEAQAQLYETYMAEHHQSIHPKLTAVQPVIVHGADGVFAYSAFP